MIEDELLAELYNLWYRLQYHGGDGKQSGLVEKYHWFLHNSEYGAECTYARKSKHLFFRDDWEETRRSILSLSDMIKQMDRK